jgi:hypothetical protein
VATARSMPGPRFEPQPRRLGTRSGPSVRASNVQGTNAGVAIVAAGVVAEEDDVFDVANRHPFR